MDYKKVFNKFAESNKETTRVVYPKTSKTSKFTFDKLDCKNSIFLAGPCPRSDWRGGAVEILNNLCFTGTVFNPTDEYYNSDNWDELENQTKWENEAMHKASAIVFNLARSEKFPGFTSNVEIGMWMDSPRIYVVIPEESKKKNANRYITIKCTERNIPIFTSLEECLAAVVKDLNGGGHKYFTSDLHLGQERTYTLSKRPFISVEDMTLKIISNINKTLTLNDEFYVLGDFGDSFKYLDCMNFKTLHFVKGNYERDKIPEIMKELKGRKDVIVYDNDECKVEIGGYKCTLRHEPITNKKLEKDEYALFGHIHSRQMIKFNNDKTGGVDVGVDAHQYKPCSEEDIIFFLNAIEKGFYDEQVQDKLK